VVRRTLAQAPGESGSCMAGGNGNGAADASDCVACMAERDADGVAQTSLASIRPCTLEMVSRMAASITGSDVDFGRHPQMPRAASALGTCSGKASASTRMRCGARRSRACSSCAHPEAWSPGMPKTSSSAFR
jgi:hypothetical protein